MEQTGTRSLEKALQLLTEVAQHDMGGARLKDLADALGLQVPTAHRLLQRLVAEGMLLKDTGSRYHLGRRIFELGLLASHRFQISDVARAALQRVADEFGDTVFLTMRNGLDMVCLARCEGSFPIKVVAMAPGTRRPLGAGVSGVAILSMMPADEADALMAANEPRFKQFGSATIGKVRHRVAFARRAGYAVTESYFTNGVGGVGVAAMRPNDVAVFALSVVGLSNRLRTPRRAEIINGLRKVARDLVDRL